MVTLRDWARIYDGCMQAKYRHKQTGEIAIQHKRRKAFAGNNCTWHITVHCDDHLKRLEH